MKTFYIKTFGCKVNQYESQVIREGFLRQGYSEARGVEDADICVVNTCTVTSVSDSKCLRFIRNACRKDRCVVATGCMVDDKDLDLSSLGGVKYIIKNRDKYRIPEIALHGARRIAHSENITGFKGHNRVFVKVQDGCDNACSYCKVRIVRGRSRSRPLKEVLDECASLIGGGSKEIVLAGICLGSYGRDISRGPSLSRLIEEICRINGHWRLRLSSIEPRDVSEDLVDQMKTQTRLCKHLHIPFQSGDDYILKKMQRPYKGSDYLNIVSRLRHAILDIAISTDIMVGFPAETEERFEDTVDFIERVRPMRMHIFPFSRRKGTEAYNYKDNIDNAVKSQRKDRLSCLAQGLSKEFVHRFIGQEVEVLVESKRSRDGYLQGYTDRYIKVYIDGPDTLMGQLVTHKLTPPQLPKS